VTTFSKETKSSESIRQKSSGLGLIEALVALMVLTTAGIQFLIATKLLRDEIAFEADSHQIARACRATCSIIPEGPKKNGVDFWKTYN